MSPMAYSGISLFSMWLLLDHLSKAYTHPVLGIKSPTSLPLILGMLCVKSTQGLIRLAPAGIGKPISLIRTSSEMHIPAPAESPMKMMSVGEMGS